MSHIHLNEKSHIKSRNTSGQLQRAHALPVRLGIDSWFKTDEKKEENQAKPNKGPAGPPCVLPRAYLVRPTVSSCRGRLCQCEPGRQGLLELGWPGRWPAVTAPAPGAAPGRARRLWALTTRRCSGALGPRTSRCRWGGTACLSAPAFHPGTRPRTARRAAL